MRFIDIVRRSGRNLKSAKIRTLLTAMALAVGGFTLSLTLAAANGARAYTQKVVAANFDPKSIIVANDEAIFGNQDSSQPREYSDDIGTAFGGTFKLLGKQDVEKIRNLPHVQSVASQYNLMAQYITREGGKRLTGAIRVYDPSQKPELKTGQIGSKLAAGTTILPDVYLADLGLASPTAAMNQSVTIAVSQLNGTLKTYNFKVVGVSSKSKLDVGFEAVGPYISEADAAAINAFVNAGTTSADKVTTVVARGDGIDADQLKKEAQDAGYVARSSKDLQSFLDQVINILQIIILVFGAITLVASFFGVINTQYISVLERTREIGLMKALGMRARAVSLLFVIEAAWIGFIGALLGSAVAVAVGTALNPWISEQINFGDERLLVFKPLQIVAMIVFLMIVTAIAGVLPARKAAKLDPIEALRTE